MQIRSLIIMEFALIPFTASYRKSPVVFLVTITTRGFHEDQSFSIINSAKLRADV